MERLLLRYNMTQFTNVMALKIIFKVDDLQNYPGKNKECEAEQEHGTIKNYKQPSFLGKLCLLDLLVLEFYKNLFVAEFPLARI